MVAMVACTQVSFSYTPDVPIFKKISLYADMESRIALVRGVFVLSVCAFVSSESFWCAWSRV